MTEIKLGHVGRSQSNSSCSVNSRGWWNKACAFKKYVFTHLTISYFYTMCFNQIHPTLSPFQLLSYTTTTFHSSFMYCFLTPGGHVVLPICVWVQGQPLEHGQPTRSHIWRKLASNPQPDEQLSTASSFSAMSGTSCAPLLSRVYMYTYIFKNIKYVLHIIKASDCKCTVQQFFFFLFLWFFSVLF